MLPATKSLMAKTWPSKIMRKGYAALGSPTVRAAFVLLLLAGCTEVRPYGGPGTVLSETPAAANSVLTCDNLAAERSAIATTLQQLAAQPGDASEAASLTERDKALTALSQSKHCPGS